MRQQDAFKVSSGYASWRRCVFQNQAKERSEESPVIFFDAPYLCLSLFVYYNMLSQSLQFAFPCRNSFFIRSSVECSPLELSSLWGRITYTISFIFALAESGRCLTSPKRGFTQIISLAQVCRASINCYYRVAAWTHSCGNCALRSLTIHYLNTQMNSHSC